MADTDAAERAKPSPGPWKADLVAGQVLDRVGRLVCGIELGWSEEVDAVAKADLQLITAAPAMYEALKRAEWTIGAMIREFFPDGEEHFRNPLPNSDLAFIRAALAAVEARS